MQHVNTYTETHSYTNEHAGWNCSGLKVKGYVKPYSLQHPPRRILTCCLIFLKKKIIRLTQFFFLADTWTGICSVHIGPVRTFLLLSLYCWSGHKSLKLLRLFLNCSILALRPALISLQHAHFAHNWYETVIISKECWKNTNALLWLLDSFSSHFLILLITDAL